MDVWLCWPWHFLKLFTYILKLPLWYLEHLFIVLFRLLQNLNLRFNRVCSLSLNFLPNLILRPFKQQQILIYQISQLCRKSFDHIPHLIIQPIDSIRFHLFHLFLILLLGKWFLDHLLVLVNFLLCRLGFGSVGLRRLFFGLRFKGLRFFLLDYLFRGLFRFWRLLLLLLGFLYLDRFLRWISYFLLVLLFILVLIWLLFFYLYRFLVIYLYG